MNFPQLPKANFACGGSLKISTQETRNSIDPASATRAPANPPVVLRWDSEKGCCKTQFPPNDNSSDPLYSGLADLVRDSSPATFGHDGKDVLDEQYRKAAKLDNTQFSTNFNPYDSGIIAAISQVLLPSFTKPKPPSSSNSAPPDQRQEYVSTDRSSLSTELYKLNIYSAPSGKFKAHVDTPRGPNQFGSLVVCLPYSHQGGELQVRHSGEQISYDWSNDDASTISWAAFYSDCEHEVFEVTSGHRVTLTYNLYIYEHLGNVVQPISSADPTKYPLYKKLSELLDSGDFMPEEYDDIGGVLGYYCEHRYAHTSKDIRSRLPYALKGRDALIYAVFQQGFGNRVHFRPVLEPVERDPDYRDSDDDEDEDRIGTGLHMIQITDAGDEDDQTLNYLAEAWKHEMWADVSWINGQWSKPGEVALVYLKYGNQAETAWHYSYLAMLIEIPKRSRTSPKDSGKKQNEPRDEENQQQGSSDGDNDVEMEVSEGAI
ncbi:hypothetical protein MMC17_008231 [Xylographa soralifera]|nr:hypothetical protein [Xylographa soralifera]